MSTATTADLLAEITRRILSVGDPERIILFGSYARGEQHPDSDIDLLIVDERATLSRDDGLRLRPALRGLLVPVDLVVTTPAVLRRYGQSPGLIYSSALAHGVTLYERPAAA
ncbi:MAG: nucleotidyltransferase domain-containing protein [Chloroflexi bacterium]|nr:nucleotidyltransferase domain-containing protein [Chloroflexota bacterium]